MPVISDEWQRRVIAGAGSGENNNDCLKVAYITDRYAIPADQNLTDFLTNKSGNQTWQTGYEYQGSRNLFISSAKDVITRWKIVSPVFLDEKQFQSPDFGILSENFT